MTLLDWSYIAGIISAITIVISLIYVGVQIANNTRAVHSSTYQAATETDFAMISFIGESEETTLLWFKYLYCGADNLTEREILRARFMMSFFLRGLENYYQHYEKGVFSEEGWEGRKAILQLTANSPGLNDFLNSELGIQVYGEFRELILKMSSNQALQPTAESNEAIIKKLYKL